MLHKSKTVLLLCVFCFILVITGCSGRETPAQSLPVSPVTDNPVSPGAVSPSTAASDIESSADGAEAAIPPVLEGAGNTPSNLLLGGIAAGYDGYIYYVDRMMWGNLWRTPLDGRAGELLQMGRFCSLNVNGDLIFALGSAADPATGSSVDGIYRMNTDGSGMTLVKEGYFVQLVLYDEYLYFTDSMDGKLYRISYEGSGETLLSEGRVDAFAVIDGALYLYAELDAEYEMNVYKMPPDGCSAPEMIIHDTFGGSIYEANGYIYFLPRANGSSNTLRYNTATGETTVFMAEWLDYINTDGEHLYYYWNGKRADNADKGLYRCSLDGSGAQLLLQTDAFFDPNITGGKMFWSSNDEQRRLNVMNLDGTEQVFVVQAED